MGSFNGREYEYASPGIEALLREIALTRGSAATIVVALVAMPADAVDIGFNWPNTITVRLPQADPTSDRVWWLMHRFISAWMLFVAVRMRYADVEGDCRLWLDDLPGGPGLAFCATGTSNVLIPDPIFLGSQGYFHFRQQVAGVAPWRERRDMVFWRGTSTGSRHHLRVAHWHELPRFRLCRLARDWGRDDVLDIGLSGIVQIWDAAELAEIEDAGLARPGVPLLAFGEYRHCLDIDGNSNTWPGLFTKFVLGATVLKVDSALGCRQWYYDRLVPWKNFVPLGQDMTELLDIAQWLVACPDEAEAIAARGRALADGLTFEAVLDQAAPRLRAALR